MRFTESFKDSIEANSHEMLEAAVELFEIVLTGQMRMQLLFRGAQRCSK